MPTALTTVSTPRSSGFQASGEPSRSRWTSRRSQPCRQVGRRRDAREGCRLPMTTEWPRFARAAATCRPMNPAPPRTSVVILGLRALHSVNSVLTEIYDRSSLVVKDLYGANGKSAGGPPGRYDRRGRPALRAALGRDGLALGREPHGVADSRAALSARPADARRGNRRAAAGGALERQQQPARAGELEPGARRAPGRRPPRPLRDRQGPLGALAGHRARAQGT